MSEYQNCLAVYTVTISTNVRAFTQCVWTEHHTLAEKEVAKYVLPHEKIVGYETQWDDGKKSHRVSVGDHYNLERPLSSW